MPELSETQLPGVGKRVDFLAEDGSRVGIVHHRTGRRELFVCAPSDPDAVAMSISLTDDESHALADALGGSSIVESLRDMTQQVEGLSIDWLTLREDSPSAGKSMGDAMIRTRTGVSVVAVLRGGETFPSPGPEFGMEAEDTLVVVGTAEGIEAAREILGAG